jgi:hypothetical protein
VLTLLWTVVVVPLLLFGQSGPAQTTPESCRKFVQAFYDWYVPKSDDDHGPMLEGALRDKRVVFGRQLYSLLEEESDAQAKTTELVTPDFDFFLFSQDPCNRYVAQEPQRSGNAYWVEVRGVCGPSDDQPQKVFAKVAWTGMVWKFVDFASARGATDEKRSLVAMLKANRKNLYPKN